MTTSAQCGNAETRATRAGGVLAVGQQRVLADDDARTPAGAAPPGRAPPGPNSSECTSRKPTPSWSTRPGSRSGQCRSISSSDTRPGRSANDTIAVWPETTQTTPGATRGTSPASPGARSWSCRTSWARSARSRSRRAIGPALSPSAAVTCQPSVVRRLSLGPVRCRLRGADVGAAEPADQLLDRLPEPVGERPALGLAVVGEDDEVVAARRQRAGPVQPAELLVDAVQHGQAVGPLQPAVVGGLVVAEEVGVGDRAPGQHVLEQRVDDDVAGDDRDARAGPAGRCRRATPGGGRRRGARGRPRPARGRCRRPRRRWCAARSPGWRSRRSSPSRPGRGCAAAAGTAAGTTCASELIVRLMCGGVAGEQVAAAGAVAGEQARGRRSAAARPRRRRPGGRRG